MLAAEIYHGSGSGDAQPRLERAGLVIDTGVDDSAVMSALVLSDVEFFLQEQEFGARESLRDYARDGESDDASADDDGVVVGVGHG